MSAILLLFVGWLAFQDGQGGNENWRDFISSPPNEIGDTLAGLFASLAFIWIVVTVFLQSIELKEQRLVLDAQRAEFAVMAEAQRAQVVAMQNQAKVFEDERLQRSQDRAKEHLDELIINLRSAIVQCGLNWVFESDGGQPFEYELYPFSPGRHHAADDEYFFRSYVKAFDQYFGDIVRNSHRKRRTPARQKLQEVETYIRAVLSLREQLSPGQMERVKRLQIMELFHEVDLYLGAEIWK